MTASRKRLERYAVDETSVGNSLKSWTNSVIYLTNIDVFKTEIDIGRWRPGERGKSMRMQLKMCDTLMMNVVDIFETEILVRRWQPAERGWNDTLLMRRQWGTVLRVGLTALFTWQTWWIFSTSSFEGDWSPGRVHNNASQCRCMLATVKRSVQRWVNNENFNMMWHVMLHHQNAARSTSKPCSYLSTTSSLFYIYIFFESLDFRATSKLSTKTHGWEYPTG